MVENHQGIETIKMELRQTFCSSGYDDICLIIFKHLSPKDDSIQCR